MASGSRLARADVIKQRKVTAERQTHITHSTVTMLGDDNLGNAVQIIVVVSEV